MAAAKKLFLVDAMAHVYRAFFAPMVRMNAPSGMPTKVPFLFNNILRRLVKDYQLLVDSHIKAVEEGRSDRIQAIDMGRRGLHDEGAALVRERLDGKIEIDFATARRLFTLVCVLHQRV